MHGVESLRNNDLEENAASDSPGSKHEFEALRPRLPLHRRWVRPGAAQGGLGPSRVELL